MYSNRYIPESLRWLIATKRYARAEQLLNYICAVNGVQLPDGFKVADLDVQVKCVYIICFRAF